MNRRHLAGIARALLLTLISVVAAMPHPAHALSLLGAEVHGELFINGGNTNFFDPENGKVPDFTYGNSLNVPGNGTNNVPITDPLIEFGYQGALDLYTVQFTGSGQVSVAATSVSFTTVTMTFSSPAFVGLGFGPVSVVGTNNHCAFSMSTISCGLTPGPGFTSTYAFSTIASVPEPASLVLLTVALAGVIAYRRKRA